MIDFLIELRKTGNDINIKFIKEPIYQIFEISFQDKSIKLWGDPILPDGINSLLLHSTENELIRSLLRNIPGHYYFLIHDRNCNSILVGNSFLSILPLYYSEKNGKLYIASSSILIAKHLKDYSQDNRFVLESILFNYPLFNRTEFINIRLLHTNSYLQWEKESLSIRKHTNVVDYFKFEKQSKAKINELVELFLERSKIYFPDHDYLHALTGGFDGRTLVSNALYHKRSFETYCFGVESSLDMKIAKSIANEIRIPNNQIKLDDNYVANYSLSNGLEFILNSSGTASFARAHYLYATKKMAAKFGIMITGNFGSELFRSAHISGSMISKNFYNLFISKSFSEAISTLKAADETKWLNSPELKLEWESLAEDLLDFPAFNSNLNGFTKNERFYLALFEEVFRKYFGAEMINQYKYIKNRTPYLDVIFFEEILKTRFAGIHSKFLENNPLKRYKGQILYNKIIQRSFPILSNFLLDKGYKPNDLFNLKGQLKITKSYLGKKIRGKKLDILDPYAVNSSFNYNRDYWISTNLIHPLINAKITNENLIKGQSNNTLFTVLSQNYLFNNIHGADV